MVRWMYAGYIILNSNKIGERFVNPETKKEILVGKVKRPYYIGQLIEITESENSISYKPTTDSCGDEKFVEKYRVESLQQKEIYDKISRQRRLRKEMHNLDNMTIKEIKEYCKTKIQKKLIKDYLEEILLW